MEYIFHEKQEGSLCAQHCLNSLLQGDYYSAIDLAQIAEELDRQELAHMSESGANMEVERREQASSNYDDSGFFSIQVIQKALNAFNLELIPYKSQNQIATYAQTDPVRQNAYICNFKEHWYTIRKFGRYWFNLNSMLKRPSYVSNTYLSILLAQLVNDGYSIFIVNGVLPQSEADLRLSTMSQDEVNAYAAQTAKTNEYLYEDTDEVMQYGAAGTSAGQSIDDDNDPELLEALKASLQHDNNLDQQEKSYREVLQTTQLSNEEEELRRAIEMSLCELSGVNTTTSKIEASPGTSKTVVSSPPAPTPAATSTVPDQTNLDEIRRKRLEFLERQNK